ncbi:hypothetical protein [Burkholderia ubonensis]|uniref:hypothetical protein n=1 Tax=Burkholderia ubonensis TaxID=101571 RepID=UPI000B171A16|nr:hypothetical protein [Burkholderia ubonensis]
MAKIFDRTEIDGSWQYRDPDEHSFVLGMMMRGFRIVEFDNLLESIENEAARDQYLKQRDATKRAFLTNQAGELAAWVTGLSQLMWLLERDAYTVPLARSGTSHQRSQKTKATKPRPSPVSEALPVLAKKTDALGKCMPAKKLWEELVTRLSDGGHDPTESGEVEEELLVTYFDDKQRKRSYSFKSFKTALSNARNKKST